MTTAHRIILHAKQAQNEQLRAAITALRAEGVRLSVSTTWEAGDAGRLTREAIALGVENVIAAGGDGSINEVLQGIVDACADKRDAAPSLGLLPLGTANDFCRSAGIPVDDLEAALRIATRAAAVPVDVVHHQGRAFINVATGGFGTDVTTETPEPLKKALGGAAYFLTGLTKLAGLAGRQATVRVGDESWSGEFIAIAVGNGRQAGGGRLLCPLALVDDGQLDVSILPTPPEDDLGEVLLSLTERGVAALKEEAIHLRGDAVEIDAAAELTLNFDGEPVRSTSFRLAVVPAALRVRLPEDCALLAQNRR